MAAQRVKRAVGIENHIATFKEAKRAVKKSGLDDRVKIRNSDISTARISDPTIVYSTLDERYGDIFRLESVLKTSCRFISASVSTYWRKARKTRRRLLFDDSPIQTRARDHSPNRRIQMQQFWKKRCVTTLSKSPLRNGNDAANLIAFI